MEDEFFLILWSVCDRNWRMNFFHYYGVCVWQRLVGEFLSLLWSECVAEPGGCVFVFIMECVCGRNWRMSFFHY